MRFPQNHSGEERSFLSWPSGSSRLDLDREESGERIPLIHRRESACVHAFAAPALESAARRLVEASNVLRN